MYSNPESGVVYLMILQVSLFVMCKPALKWTTGILYWIEYSCFSQWLIYKDLYTSSLPCPALDLLSSFRTETQKTYPGISLTIKKEFPLLHCTSPWPLIKKFHINLIYFKFLYHFPPEIYTKWQTTCQSMRWPTTCFWRTVKALTRSQRNPQYGFFCGLAKSS